MGLLSEPEKQRKIIVFLCKHARLISIALVVAAIAHTIHMVQPGVPHNNHIQDNSLIPGQARPGVSAQHWKQAQKLLSTKKDIEPSSLESALRHQLNLETWTQTFNFSGPDERRLVHGVNVMAVVRSKRAVGTEAMLIHVDLGRRKPLLNARMAVALGLYFKDVEWLHKDLWLVFTQGSNAGVRAFMELYTGTDQEGVDAITAPGVPSFARIRAGLTLAVTDAKFDLFHCHLVGKEGMLPNFDYFDALRIIANKKRIHCLFETEPLIGRVPFKQLWWQNGISAWRFLRDSLNPTSFGPHGEMLANNIPSFALSTRQLPQAGGRLEPVTFLETVEELLHSINNMGQRFNLSFTLYIPMPLGTHLPFGLLATSIGLWVGAIVIIVATTWWRAGGIDELAMVDYKALARQAAGLDKEPKEQVGGSDDRAQEIAASNASKDDSHGKDTTDSVKIPMLQSPPWPMWYRPIVRPLVRVVATHYMCLTIHGLIEEGTLPLTAPQELLALFAVAVAVVVVSALLFPSAPSPRLVGSVVSVEGAAARPTLQTEQLSMLCVLGMSIIIVAVNNILYNPAIVVFILVSCGGALVATHQSIWLGRVLAPLLLVGPLILLSQSQDLQSFEAWLDAVRHVHHTFQTQLWLLLACFCVPFHVLLLAGSVF